VDALVPAQLAATYNRVYKSCTNDAYDNFTLQLTYTLRRKNTPTRRQQFRES